MSAQDELLLLRIKATASLQHQMAEALLGKGQEELRRHFLDSAVLLVEAAGAIKRVAA